MAVDRTTIRRAIGRKTGDLLTLKATSAAANASSFSDVVRLGDRGDRAPSITSRIGYFSGGTVANLGHECRVTDFASATRTLTFAPVANTEPQTGDELELWSVAERIGSIDDLHGIINDAIRAVDSVAEGETWDTAQTWDSRTQILTIPSTWVEFGGADWVDGRGYRHEVPPSRLRVRPGQRTVELLGNTAFRAHRRAVTLWGFPRALPLNADSDETNVDFQWLVESVAGVLTLAGSWRASDVGAASSERRANFWAQQAAMYRRDVASPRRGLGIPLP